MHTQLSQNQNVRHIQVLLRGIGQVFFQNNHWTGVVFLIGIFVNSWIMGIGAMLGTIIGTATAIILKYPIDEIENGLYGFNGVLIGLGILFFYNTSLPIVYVAIIIATIASSIFMHMLLKNKLPAFTFPFIFFTWIVYYLFKYMNIQFAEPIVALFSPNDTKFDMFFAFGTAYGQGFFQGNILSGIFFFLGILLNSRISAAYSLLGTALGGILGFLIYQNLPSFGFSGIDIHFINIGLFGFNGIFCGIALGSEANKSSFIYATLAIIIAFILFLGFIYIGMIALTAPFVFATWIVLFLKNRISQ